MEVSDAERAAQELHDHRRDTDRSHDQSSCWCCCMDCGFDWEDVTGQRKGERHGGDATL